MDIKVLFYSCQGGPTNIQSVGGGMIGISVMASTI